VICGVLPASALDKAVSNRELVRDTGACHGLLVDVVYHAIKDVEALNENSDRVYVDDDHRAFCNTRGFPSGRTELRLFFKSLWFRHLCDAFQDIGADEIIKNINL